jgi:uncharacterized membrane protein
MSSTSLPARPTLSKVVVFAALAAAVVARFFVVSHLWLDEALTVNIARLPLRDIPGALKHDGAPPLYYFLLHGWMQVFGSGDVAVRALSGVFGTAALPAAWLAGRRLGGRRVAVMALVLVSASPFAVRYAVEARMYGLIILFTLAGVLAVEAALRRPSPPALGAVAVVSGLLLLTHYWALYVVAVTFVALVVRRHWAVAGAVAAGGVLFIPWTPVFLYQLAHTGAPWGSPAGPGALVDTVLDFGGAPYDAGKLLGAGLLVLVYLGATSASTHARALLLVAGATVLCGLVATEVSSSAYVTRYAAVALAPTLVGAAFAVNGFTERATALVCALAVGLGAMVVSIEATTERTQAGRVAAALRRRAVPGDVIGFCPDQLAPAVLRLLPAARWPVHTFPANPHPERVDWVDYEKRIIAQSPEVFALRLSGEAGPNHRVWLVASSGYRPFGTTCSNAITALTGTRPDSVTVVSRSVRYFERMSLVRFDPP